MQTVLALRMIPLKIVCNMYTDASSLSGLPTFSDLDHDSSMDYMKIQRL